MTYQQLVDNPYPEGDVGVEAIKYTLKSRGYKRYIALRKPPLSEANCHQCQDQRRTPICQAGRLAADRSIRVAGYYLATFNARSLDTRVEIRQRELVIFHVDTLPFRLSTGLTVLRAFTTIEEEWNRGA
jgi:hypothetical protein